MGNRTFRVITKEIQAYIGVLLLSGYTIVPRTCMCWSHDKNVRIQAVFEAMSRDPFEKITIWQITPSWTPLTRWLKSDLVLP